MTSVLLTEQELDQILLRVDGLRKTPLSAGQTQSACNSNPKACNVNRGAQYDAGWLPVLKKLGCETIATELLLNIPQRIQNRCNALRQGLGQFLREFLLSGSLEGGGAIDERVKEIYRDAFKKSDRETAKVLIDIVTDRLDEMIPGIQHLSNYILSMESIYIETEKAVHKAKTEHVVNFVITDFEKAINALQQSWELSAKALIYELTITLALQSLPKAKYYKQTSYYKATVKTVLKYSRGMAVRVSKQEDDHYDAEFAAAHRRSAVQATRNDQGRVMVELDEKEQKYLRAILDKRFPAVNMNEEKDAILQQLRASAKSMLAQMTLNASEDKDIALICNWREVIGFGRRWTYRDKFGYTWRDLSMNDFTFAYKRIFKETPPQTLGQRGLALPPKMKQFIQKHDASRLVHGD
jgi:hypothetical protein